MTDLAPLRFTWARTWPDDRNHPHDFFTRPYDGYPTSLRIRKDATSQGRDGQWHWVANGDVFIARGWEPNARRAARAAERAFLEALAHGRTRPLGTKTAGEIFAAAIAPAVDVDY